MTNDQTKSKSQSANDPKYLQWSLGFGHWSFLTAGVNFEEWFVKLDGFAVFTENGDDFATDFGRNFVEDFHRFDEAEDGRGIDPVSDFHVGLCLGIGAGVERTDHRTFDDGDVRAVG